MDRLQEAVAPILEILTATITAENAIALAKYVFAIIVLHVSCILYFLYYYPCAYLL